LLGRAIGTLLIMLTGPLVKLESKKRSRHDPR
jgi:hypothetical protein